MMVAVAATGKSQPSAQLLVLAYMIMASGGASTLPRRLGAPAPPSFMLVFYLTASFLLDGCPHDSFELLEALDDPFASLTCSSPTPAAMAWSLPGMRSFYVSQDPGHG